MNYNSTNQKQNIIWYQYEASYEAMGTNMNTQYEHSDKWVRLGYINDKIYFVVQISIRL